MARLTVVMSNNRPIIDLKVLDIDLYPDIYSKLFCELSHIIDKEVKLLIAYISKGDNSLFSNTFSISLSVKTTIPNSCALVNLEPADSPATT